ncbi:MAG: esterase-like activity of phytase family protein [Kiritimatiellae bacterium]|nr:esterase-like activity of phytase family protein [Kiritimatiellia bacterium]
MKLRLPALLVLAASAAAGDGVSLAVGRTFTRPSVPKSLSGVTYLGGNRYWAVADDGTGAEGGLYEFTAELGPEGTNVVSFSICSTNERVRLGSAADLEGCAYDPATGWVWASDEGGRNVRAYDPATGEQVGGVHVPYVLTTHPGNFGFEALSMRGDGLALWTCNEEALVGDGARSSHAAGTTVRLAKYSRRSVRDEFALEAMYPYTTDAWTYANDYRGKARLGVAGLCALPDGSLLVLERELSFDDKMIFGVPYVFRLGWRVYRVGRPEDATDVQDFDSLADGATWTGVGKTFLAEGDGVSNCEGICLGPRLADGRLSVLLLSDAGDGYSAALLQPLVLSGLDVATLDFPPPDASLGADAAASSVGSNYRFLAGTRLSVELSGSAADAARHAAGGTSVPLPRWSLASGAASGAGTVASFEVSGDDTLLWTGLSAALTVATGTASVGDAAFFRVKAPR